MKRFDGIDRGVSLLMANESLSRMRNEKCEMVVRRIKIRSAAEVRN